MFVLGIVTEVCINYYIFFVLDVCSILNNNANNNCCYYYYLA